ncbi:MAG: hypothetical protein P4M11_10160 [Candidatus Pacebacteria bacterium]|nr:hypothetical protein [Candidatus Paceibacterota bacterium]
MILTPGVVLIVSFIASTDSTENFPLYSTCVFHRNICTEIDDPLAAASLQFRGYGHRPRRCNAVALYLSQHDNRTEVQSSQRLLLGE